MDIKDSFISLGLVVQAIREHRLGEYDGTGKYKDNPEYFDLYCEYSKSEPRLSDVVFVGEPAYIDEEKGDEDNDYTIIPESAKDKGWELLYSGQLIESVIYNAVNQQPNIDNSAILKATEYYMKHDCFYDFINVCDNAGTL